MLLLLACVNQPADTATDSAAEGACAASPEVSWEGWADGFFATWCRACHSASTQERNGAPTGLDFDSPAQVRQNEAAIRNSVLVAERMPVGGGVFPDELALLEAYLDCGL